MAINVELRSEQGQVLGRAGGDGLLERLARPLEDESSPCLRWLDLYGDTMFNALQATALVKELEVQGAHLPPAEVGSLNRLLELANQCADEVHLYLWCIGD